MRFRLAALVLLASALAGAQEYRALISGQVTDPSGAAIAGASIVATNTATNVSVTTTAGADGRYVLAQVASGGYTISCEARGFKKFVRTGVTLNVGDGPQSISPWKSAP